MTRFSEKNPVRIGMVGLAAIVVVLLLAFNINGLTALLIGRSYSALLTEAGGLRAGDEVRLGGLKIGRVDSVELAGPSVRVDFTVTNGNAHLGKDTTVSVDVATVLGERNLGLVSRGPQTLSSDQPIPVARTHSAYDLPEVLETLSTKTSELDVDKVSTALNTVSDTIAGTSPQLKGAMDGVIRLSGTLNSRDAQLRELLHGAENVSGVLADRSGQLRTLVTDGNLLLTELNNRRETIHQLFENVAEMSRQLNGLVGDQRNRLKPTLDTLNSVLELLKDNEDNLSAAITGGADYATGFGEAVSSGPWFSANILNLVAPGNLAPLSNVLPELAPKGPSSMAPLRDPAPRLPGLPAPSPGGTR